MHNGSKVSLETIRCVFLPTCSLFLYSYLQGDVNSLHTCKVTQKFKDEIADLRGAENSSRATLCHKDSSRVELCFDDSLVKLLCVELH